MAKTSEADLYSNYSIPDFINDQLTIRRHPRARGKHELDTTVPFDSQKDRHLDRGQWLDQYPPRCAIHVRPRLGLETPTYESPMDVCRGTRCP